MSSGKTTARTGSALEAAATAKSDVAALSLQLLVELAQRHSQIAKTFDGNTYLLRYLGSAPQEGDDAEAAVEETAEVAQPKAKRRKKAAAAEESPKEPATQEAAEAAAEDAPAAGGQKKKKRKKPVGGL
mmetsp:Transcript_66905/g.144342  ORF Transcript_66905/g.144342 Transcript_66905/m.144342 type:complete len:129 (+) Transcript_66905:1-387(+)